MKHLKFNTLVIVSLMAILTICFTSTSFAADKIIDTKIKTMTIQNDKNGNEYCRFIITEEKELSGVKYSADTIVMAFGADLVAQVKSKQLSDGAQLKAIVAQNEYRGRINYNLIAFVN